ncbi:MAG: aldo/keto reductase [Reichenbachiella sp.]|uniref:aldo/keto reductase n=1 Tax=Reichenbachiella sp. TaxID=2184521 RepID=UPI0032999E07
MKKIGLGTAAIGRPQYINIKQDKTEDEDLDVFRERGLKVLDTAYEKGVRYFDTAPGYGMAEQLLLDWVQTKADDSIEIATKWGYTYVANFDPKATIHEVKDHSLNQLLKQWQISKELKPYLSTLQVHSATFESGILQDEKVLNKLAELKANQDIRIGITTTGDNQIEVLQAAMDTLVQGIPLFEVYQVTYNILDHSLTTIADKLLESGKRIVIKEALANGRVFRNSSYPAYQAMYDALEKMAQKYEVGVDAIALRYCMDSINPYAVLSGASAPIQIEENLKAFNFQLDEQELSILKAFSLDPKLYWSERKKLDWN